MNFHDLEMNVIRHAEANKLLDVPPWQQAQFTVETVEQLCAAISKGERVAISDAMGRAAIDMIRLCAMLDIDLSKCMEQAFAKISAKPEVASNVVFLNEVNAR
jgi:hypothetical protein